MSLLFDRSLQKNYTQSNDQLVCNGKTIPVVNEISGLVENDNDASAFGAQWKAYRQTQLDSYTGHSIMENRMARCFGEGFDKLTARWRWKVYR